MTEHCKQENTDEIVCPYPECHYEFGDSWEYIPKNEDGEIGWVEECPECGRYFDVAFDARNVDDGYTSSIPKCKDGEHNYEVRNKLHTSDSRTSISKISITSRIEVCTVCDDWQFIPVKSDGSDFTKKEINDFKLKKRLEAKDKKYNSFNGKKEGSFGIDLDRASVRLKLHEPEGNIKLWVGVCRWLRSKGFKAQVNSDLCGYKISLKRKWLECDVSVENYALSISFFQNETLDSREKGRGRHEYDPYKLLTTQMKVELRACLHMIKKYLISNGFNFNQKQSDLDRLKSRLKVEDLSNWVDPDGYGRDKEDSNGIIMKSGDVKYFYVNKVLTRGVIWWNNGNQWFIMCNGTLHQTAHFYLFDYNGEPARKPLSKDAQVQRLHTELTHNEKEHNYDRCKSLWNILQSYKLYNVWSIKHGSWWGKNNGGYTPNKENAGVYTHENIMKWTEPTKPTEGVSFYDHVIAETPIGRMIIEWKSWKESPSYDIELDGTWIGVSYDLDTAKEVCVKYLKDITEKLTEYMYGL